jgi:hypothetical protein
MRQIVAVVGCGWWHAVVGDCLGPPSSAVGDKRNRNVGVLVAGNNRTGTTRSRV